MNRVESLDRLPAFQIERERVPVVKALFERGAVLCDFISVTRNSTLWSSQFTKMAPLSIVPFLQVVPGSIGVVIGLKGMYDTAHALAFESNTMIERVRYGMGFVVISSFTLLCGLLFAIGLSSSLALGSAAGTLIVTVGIPFFYGSLLASGCIKAVAHSYFLHSFAKEFADCFSLKEKSERLKLLLQQEGFSEWIYFNTDGKDPLLHQMLEKLCEDSSLFQNHQLVSEVIDEILLSARKRRFEQVVAMIIGALGLASLSMGPISSVVFALSAIIWLVIDSSDVNLWITDSLYGKSILEKYSSTPLPSGLIGDAFSLIPANLQSKFLGS